MRRENPTKVFFGLEFNVGDNHYCDACSRTRKSEKVGLRDGYISVLYDCGHTRFYKDIKTKG